MLCRMQPVLGSSRLLPPVSKLRCVQGTFLLLLLLLLRSDRLGVGWFPAVTCGDFEALRFCMVQGLLVLLFAGRESHKLALSFVCCCQKVCCGWLAQADLSLLRCMFCNGVLPWWLSRNQLAVALTECWCLCEALLLLSRLCSCQVAGHFVMPADPISWIFVGGMSLHLAAVRFFAMVACVVCIAAAVPAKSLKGYAACWGCKPCLAMYRVVGAGMVCYSCLQTQRLPSLRACQFCLFVNFIQWQCSAVLLCTEVLGKLWYVSNINIVERRLCGASIYAHVIAVHVVGLLQHVPVGLPIMCAPSVSSAECTLKLCSCLLQVSNLQCRIALTVFTQW
jgi:hypothetical protein